MAVKPTIGRPKSSMTSSDFPTVNRRLTLTPSFGSKWLYQQRNGRFLDGFIGFQS